MAPSTASATDLPVRRRTFRIPLSGAVAIGLFAGTHWREVVVALVVLRFLDHKRETVARHP